MFSSTVRRSLLAALAAIVLLPAAAEAKKVEVKPGTGTLQKAVDKAKPGDKLVLKANRTYKGGVEIEKRLTIKGPGNGERLPAVDGRCREAFTVLVFGNPVTLKNFEVTGSTDAQGSQYGGAEVNFIEGGGGSVSGMRFEDTCGVLYGVNVFDTGDVLVADSRFEGYDDAGVYVGGIRSPEDAIEVTGNTATEGNTGVLIEDSESHGGIVVSGNATNANEAGFTPRGIFIRNSDDVVISDNVADGNSFAGLWLDATSDDNRVLNNQGSGNGLNAQAEPGADLINDGAGNCGSGNAFGTSQGNPLAAC